MVVGRRETMPGGRRQRCRDAPALLRRACLSAAAVAYLVESGQPLAHLGEPEGAWSFAVRFEQGSGFRVVGGFLR